ncbi:MAG: hypothetical protein ABSE42_11080 [Bryobacteraceae bacterium]|jgi:hypothetical protein
MKRTIRLFLFVTALGAGGALVAQDPPIRVDFALRSSTVESGVPVIVTVTVRNDTDMESARFLPFGRYEVDWLVRSRDGAEVAQWKPTGDTGSLGRNLPPHSVEKFSIVASGTSAIQSPGEYEIFPRYRTLDVSERLPFTVVPSSAESLGLRAQEFHDAAVVKGEDGLTAAEALASMAYAVPASQLCDVMERNPSAPYFIAPRLEAMGGADAVHCLIRVLSGAPVQGIYIQWALQRLGKSEKDQALRSEIQKALGQ